MRRFPLLRRLLATAIAVAAYALLFPWLYARFDDATGIFMLLPIFVAAGVGGLRGGLAVGVLSPLVQLGVYRLHGHPHALAGVLVASLPQSAIGVLVGALVDLPGKLRREAAALSAALGREREARAQLAEAQRLARTGSFEWDLATGAMCWSGELYRLAELDPSEPPDFERFLARIHPDDRAGMVGARAQVARDGVPYDRHYRLVLGDGTVRRVHARSEVERDPAGRPCRILGTLQDVTERAQLEEQLAVAARLAPVGDLAGRVAGELGQPLRRLWAGVAALQEELASAGDALPPELRAEAAAALGDALSGCSRVDRIVSDLEVLVTGEAQARPIPLDRILDAAVAWVLPELQGRARLHQEYAGLPAVACDEGRLIRAFCSLLRNAAQSFPAPGREENVVRVSAGPAGAERVCVEVLDTGSGISPEIRGRIFDPFFTTRPVDAGIGLGLSVCRAIVRSVGGEISVQSEPGRGSRFRVCLPVHREEGGAGAAA